jgi:hypothetical protein
MSENKNISSKLDGLFDVARKQQPVMNLNEINDLIKNPSAHQKRKAGALTWFGVFLLIGLGAFGVSFLLNNNSSADTQSVNSIEVTSETQPVTNETQAEKNTIQASAAVAAKQDEASASAGKSDSKNTASESSLANKDDIKNTASTDKSDHAVLAHGKSKSNAGTVSKHYEGDATITFLSDNKKVKMTITPTNEIEELKVNDQLISNESYKNYKNIIDEGLKLKNEKTKNEGGSNAEEQTLSAAKRNVMNAMIKELTSDGLISPDKSFDFTLTGQEIFLNNEKQSVETFEKYKGTYEKITGEKLPAKYNLHIRR